MKKQDFYLTPIFSASKLRWLKDKSKSIFKRSTTLFGTIDSFLLWKLTEGRVFATDITNAAENITF